MELISPGNHVFGLAGGIHRADLGKEKGILNVKVRVIDEIAQAFFDDLEPQLATGYRVRERGRGDSGPYFLIGELLEIGVEKTNFPTTPPAGDYRHVYDAVIRLGDQRWGRVWNVTVRSLTRGEWVRNAVPALLELLQQAYSNFGREDWRGSMTPQWEPVIDAHDERFKSEYKWPIFRPLAPH